MFQSYSVLSPHGDFSSSKPNPFAGTTPFAIGSRLQGGAAPIAISGRLIRFAKLSLLASLVFSLKDAADRGRLDGTTFVQLNFLSSFAFGTMAGKFTRRPKIFLCFSWSVYVFNVHVVPDTHMLS